ncbi:MAG: toprim domain-containing protein [Nitrospiraceae bacterium]|nr:toprim domain-containing protein [Nitrospiraceae bacterium]
MSVRKDYRQGKNQRAARNGDQVRVLTAPADAERAERLREVLDGLIEINRAVPIIVEGKRDASALQCLGFEGEIIILHRGQNLYDFSEQMLESYGKMVLLLDWDEKGDQMTRALEESLKGHFEEFRFFRDTIRILCQKDIKDIEAIPTLLRRLEGIAGKSAPGPDF